MYNIYDKNKGVRETIVDSCCGSGETISLYVSPSLGYGTAPQGLILWRFTQAV